MNYIRNNLFLKTNFGKVKNDINNLTINLKTFNNL